MYKDHTSSGSSSTASRKGDEVELVNRFLAPLCARDETARNLALAAARTTVEGWLGGVGSPNNNWEMPPDYKDKGTWVASKSISPKNSPFKAVRSDNANLNYRLQMRDGFFSQRVSEGAAKIFSRKASYDTNPVTPERYPSGSFDCVDGKPNFDQVSSSECKGASLGHENRLLNNRLKEAENRFCSSADSERRFFLPSNEGLSESLGVNLDEKRGRNYRLKGGRQKQFDEEDELEASTRIYGKSPKFDDDFGNHELRSRFKSRDNGIEPTEIYATSLEAENVVFNTLEGFSNNEASSNRNSNESSVEYCAGTNSVSVERKISSAGQIKRPLSQDEDLPWKSGRVVESPVEVVTPGDVGRMLNLGNALDGPRQAQPNKYLSLVSLHLPVILRLSINCPFQNVRIKCAEILQMVKVRTLLLIPYLNY